MAATILSAAVVGLDAQLIDVEADTAFGLPKMCIVGLPDTAVQEARERVRSGIKNSGLIFPGSIVTVNLAPADLRKEGSAYDLPMALAILTTEGQLMIERPDERVFVGELSLDGRLRPIHGALAIAAAVQREGIPELYVPAPNAREAALVSGLAVYPVRDVVSLVRHLAGEAMITPLRHTKYVAGRHRATAHDLAVIRGQEHAKRALEIAAAGGHNVLMTGPPGSGKTLLARSLATILPPLQFEEALAVTKIYSVAGRLDREASLIDERPFRAPHHTLSSVALVGGGSFPRPGEISLAHRGVLFLDEFSEFSREALESLRQPLEEGIVTVSRAAGSVHFPARFTLVAAQNPCPCGYLNDQRRPCTCTPQQIIRYHKKVSGPLLDRIDLHITVPRLDYEKMAAPPHAERSAVVRERVVAARELQLKRFTGEGGRTNAEMSVRHVTEYCALSAEAEALMKGAVNQLYLSGRSYHRLLKVARTIADLAGQEKITAEHVAEALQYRAQA